jgi:hypothetical protein
MQRLTDAEMITFISHGYHLVETDFPPEFHRQVVAELEAHPKDQGNGVLAAVPALQQVYDHSRVKGALVSILGEDCQMNGHRHCHVIPPHKMSSQGWHQDGTNVRHHQTRTVLAMYYPHDVPPDMGPTAILPGTHFRNAPTDRMSSYTNIKGTRFLTVKAGTVAITHYDLWHAGTLNRTDRPRYMLKFLFDRMSPPKPGAPSWDHDAVNGERLAQERSAEMVGAIQHYGTDLYKEWELRKEMWEWYMGRGPVGAGVFKDMLV